MKQIILDHHYNGIYNQRTEYISECDFEIYDSTVGVLPDLGYIPFLPTWVLRLENPITIYDMKIYMSHHKEQNSQLHYYIITFYKGMTFHAIGTITPRVANLPKIFAWKVKSFLKGYESTHDITGVYALNRVVETI